VPTKYCFLTTDFNLKMLKQTISRVLFPEVSLRAMVIPLEKRFPAPSSDLPGSYGRTTLLMLPYLVLLRVGFTKHLMSPSGLVSSYLTVSPLPRMLTGENPVKRRSIFCGTFLPVAGTGCYPAPCPVGLGLSSRPDTLGPATILSALADLFTPLEKPWLLC